MSVVGRLRCRVGLHRMRYDRYPAWEGVVQAMACIVGHPYWMRCCRCGRERRYPGSDR